MQRALTFFLYTRIILARKNMSTGRLSHQAEEARRYPKGSLEDSISKLRKEGDARVSIGKEIEVGAEIARTLLAEIDGNRASVTHVLYKFRTLAPTKLEVVVGDPKEIAEEDATPLLHTPTEHPGISIVSEAHLPVGETERNERKVIQSDPFERILVLTSMTKILLQDIYGKKNGYEKYRSTRDGLMDTMRQRMKLHDELISVWVQVKSGGKKTHNAINLEMQEKLKDDMKLLALWDSEFVRQNGAPDLKSKTYDDFTYEIESEIANLVELRNQSIQEGGVRTEKSED